MERGKDYFYLEDLTQVSEADRGNWVLYRQPSKSPREIVVGVIYAIEPKKNSFSVTTSASAKEMVLGSEVRGVLVRGDKDLATQVAKEPEIREYLLG
jgi:hypothetical protein